MMYNRLKSRLTAMKASAFYRGQYREAIAIEFLLQRIMHNQNWRWRNRSELVSGN